MKRIPRFLGFLTRLCWQGSWGLCMTLWSVVVIVAGTHISLEHWESLNGGESPSATIRNLVVVVAGLVGLPLTLWRSCVAARQADTAQRNLLEQRYQKGAEMLGSADVWTRVGGVFALQGLAQDHPQQYHVQIMRLFCAFFRQNARPSQSAVEREVETNDVKEKESSTGPTSGIFQGAVTDGLNVPETQTLAQDSQAIFNAFSDRGRKQIELEKGQGYRLDLTDLNLRKMDLRGAKFENADLSGTDLSEAILWQAHFGRTRLRGTMLRSARLGAATFEACDELTHSSPLQLGGANLFDSNFDEANLFSAQLAGANLTCASLRNANLSGANLAGANLSSADVSGATFSQAVPNPRRRYPAVGLTQTQLDNTSRQPSRPPFLEHVADAITGEPLVWSG